MELLLILLYVSICYVVFNGVRIEIYLVASNFDAQ